MMKGSFVLVLISRFERIWILLCYGRSRINVPLTDVRGSILFKRPRKYGEKQTKSKNPDLRKMADNYPFLPSLRSTIDTNAKFVNVCTTVAFFFAGGSPPLLLLTFIDELLPHILQ